nr:unnamed protein product [Digitaria exilis]
MVFPPYPHAGYAPGHGRWKKKEIETSLKPLRFDLGERLRLRFNASYALSSSERDCGGGIYRAWSSRNWF